MTSGKLNVRFLGHVKHPINTPLLPTTRVHLEI